jgi:hypothetical protein
MTYFSQKWVFVILNIQTMLENPFEVLSSKIDRLTEKLDKLALQSQANEIIDRTELRKRLDLSEPTVIKYVAEGIIPEFKIKGEVRYNWQRVIEKLEGNKKFKKN